MKIANELQAVIDKLNDQKAQARAVRETAQRALDTANALEAQVDKALAMVRAYEDSGTVFATENCFTRALYKEVLPMRAYHVSVEIVSAMHFAAEKGGLDLDGDITEIYGLKSLYPKQQRAVVTFLKAHCPRNKETGFWMPCWDINS